MRDRTDTEPEPVICPECDLPYDGYSCDNCSDWCKSELIAMEIRKVINKPEELKETIEDFERYEADKILVRLSKTHPLATEIVITLKSGRTFTHKNDKNGK